MPECLIWAIDLINKVLFCLFDSLTKYLPSTKNQLWPDSKTGEPAQVFVSLANLLFGLYTSLSTSTHLSFYININSTNSLLQCLSNQKLLLLVSIESSYRILVSNDALYVGKVKKTKKKRSSIIDSNPGAWLMEKRNWKQKIYDFICSQTFLLNFLSTIYRLLVITL